MASKYNSLVKVRTILHGALIGLTRLYYNKVWGTHIGKGTRISRTAKVDLTNPGGIYIGQYSSMAFGSSILTHDFVNGVHLETRVGDYCFIGAHAIIMPGVTIGDHCIIATGSIVMRDVPSNTVSMGNPARVLEKGIMTGKYGQKIPNPPLRDSLRHNQRQPHLTAMAHPSLDASHAACRDCSV